MIFKKDEELVGVIVCDEMFHQVLVSSPVMSVSLGLWNSQEEDLWQLSSSDSFVFIGK